eukprot:TRINITY_DN2585_c0_g1_i5.p1 TRINITY_DN2585_c0_g1~~TRINITY_DN2585_c0_g1_i5.p1  ORF type:complete len:583 (-),score=127.13 TRINITY_DN2585_c0_g1_i5:107-1855(-)
MQACQSVNVVSLVGPTPWHRVARGGGNHIPPPPPGKAASLKNIHLHQLSHHLQCGIPQRLRITTNLQSRAIANEKDESKSDLLLPVASAVKAAMAAVCIAYLTYSVPNLPAAESATLPCESVDDYYSSTRGLSGPTLKSKLHDIINNHNVYTYAQVWDALKILDAADEVTPEQSSDIIEIYAQQRAPKELAAKPEGWNREHLWPRSFGLVQGQPEFSDLHNLRPADVNLNSSRGNKIYGICTSECTTPANREAAADTAANKELWTPPGQVRGDIARALMYMAVRYDGSTPGTFDLELSDEPSVAKAQMGKLSSLLLWTELDPPSKSEKLRNDRVCSLFQHNRNPFVDHPEFASLIWGPGASSSVTSVAQLPYQTLEAAPVGSPSAPAPSTAAAVPSSSSSAAKDPPLAWINEIHYENGGPDQAEFIEVVVGPGVDASSLAVYLYNGADGKPYLTLPLAKFLPGQITKSGYAFFSTMLPPGSIQNGPADGFALTYQSVDPNSGKKVGKPKVIQFLSYEGLLEAKDGVAKGLKSTDIGVKESETSAVSDSLALVGTGKKYEDFVWRVIGDRSSFGRLNTRQVIE